MSKMDRKIRHCLSRVCKNALNTVKKLEQHLINFMLRSARNPNQRQLWLTVTFFTVYYFQKAAKLLIAQTPYYGSAKK